MKKITCLLFLIAICFTTNAQTSLTVGDIAFVGSNTSGATNADDNFSFVLLKNIEANTEIIFTDRGWNDIGGFSNFLGDGEFTWVSTTNRSAGEIISLDLSALNPAAAAYSYIGDQLFAIQGTIVNPIFISGINFNHEDGVSTDENWDDEATDNTTSALPNELLNGTNAIRLIDADGFESDNWQFSCTKAGGLNYKSYAEAALAINNRDNWQSNSNSYDPAIETGCEFIICNTPDTPSLTLSSNNLCPETATTINISGDLNGAVEWVIYSTSCGGTKIGSTTGNTFEVTPPNGDTTYFIRGEDGTGCIDESTATCASIIVTSEDLTIPSAIAQDLTIQIDENGITTITPDQINNGSTDNCTADGDLALSLDKTEFSCADVGGDNVSSLNFDGNAVVRIPDSPELRLQNDMAMEAWFKADGFNGDWVRVLGKGASGPRNYGLWYNPNGTWLFQQYGDGVSVQLNKTINIGEWYHFAAVKSGNTAKLYVNGVLVASASGGTNPAVSNDPLTIGYAGFHTYHLGQIDEVRLWDYARTDLEIAENYNKILSGQEIGLVAYYNMEDTQAVALEDLSGNGHEGVFQGFDPSTMWAQSSSEFVDKNQVTLTVTDANGNKSSAIANIKVEDKIAPTITCPGNMEVDNDLGVDGAVVTYNILVSDNCEIPQPEKPDFTNLGAYNGKFYYLSNASFLPVDAFTHAEQNGGNIVTINSAAENSIVNNLLGGTSAMIGFTDEVTEGEFVWKNGEAVTYTNWGPGEPNNSGPEDYTQIYSAEGLWNDYKITTDIPYVLEVTIATQTAGLSSGSQFPIGTTTNTFEVTDISGNKSTCSFTVTVNDLEAPAGYTVGIDQAEIDENNETAVSFTLAAAEVGTTYNYTFSSDNGGSDVTGSGIISTPTDQLTGIDLSGLENGTITLSVTLTDAANNKGIAATDTKIKNTNEAPVAVCRAFTAELDASGNVTITAEDVDGGSSDDKAGFTLSLDKDSFDCSNIGENVVELTITDSDGVQSSCFATVTVEDNEAPTAIVQNVTVQLDENGQATIRGDYFVGPIAGQFEPQNSSSISAAQDCDCPEGFVAVGYEGYSGWIVDDFRLICKEVLADGNLGTETIETCFSGSQSNLGISNILTDNEILVGFQIQDGDFQHQQSARTHVSVKGIGKALKEVASGSQNNIENSILSGINGSGTATTNLNTTTRYAPAGHAIVGMSVNQTNGYSSSVSFKYAPISSFLSIDNGSNDACGIASISVSQDSFTCDEVGENTVTFTVVDTNGNESTTTSIVTVEDNVIPVITQPADLILNTDLQECSYTFEEPLTVEVTDNCSIENITGIRSDGLSLSDPFPLGETIIEWTATDVNENVSSGAGEYEKQKLSSPADFSGEETLIDFEGLTVGSNITNEFSDQGVVFLLKNGLGAEVWNDPTPKSYGPSGDIALNNFPDNSGNYNLEMTFTEAINKIGFEIRTNSNDDLNLLIKCIRGGTVCHSEFYVTDLNFKFIGFESPEPFEQVIIEVITNYNGAFSLDNLRFEGGTEPIVQKITVIDNIAPVLTAEADQEVILDADCSITVPNLIDGSSATDNCTVTITQSPVAGTIVSSSHNGTVEVVVTATDEADNIVESTVVLTAKDNEAPVLVVEEDQDVVLDADCSITVPNLIDGSSATDNCPVTITQSPVSGTIVSSSHNGTVEVVVTATDAAENIDELTVVLTAKDNEAPVLIAEADQEVILDADCSITVPNLVDGSSATDNCIVTITQSPVAGTIVESSHNGTVDVIVTATDAANNKVESTVVLTAKDNEAPVLAAEADQEVILDADCSITVPNLVDGSSATDNCMVTITQSPVAGTIVESSHNGTVDVIVTATDAANNKVESTVVLTAKDVTAPIADADQLDDITAVCEILEADFAIPTATDNCGGTVSVSHDASFPITAQGLTVITWSFEDVNGNIATQTQDVMIEDMTAPVPDVATLEDIVVECEATTLVAPTATDNCGGSITATTLDPTSYSEEGEYMILWEFNDGNGNVFTQEQWVTVKDNTAPEVSVQDLTVIVTQDEPAVITPEEVNDGSIDNCSDLVFTLDKDTFDKPGVYEVILTATDASGNTSQATAKITVKREGADPKEAHVVPTMLTRTSIAKVILPFNGRIREVHVMETETNKYKVFDGNKKNTMQIDIAPMKGTLLVKIIDGEGNVYMKKLIAL